MEQTLKFCQFGAENGKPVVYFHGVPGAPEECAVFDSMAKQQGITLICFDRFAIDASIDGEAYYRYLADEILKFAGGKPVDFIGFSIGAFVTLQTCRYMNGGVKNLHLISAVAPLEAGDFLDAMAGKQIFQLAKAKPWLLVLLTTCQGVLARWSSRLLFRLLFRNAEGEDKNLAADPEFQRWMIEILRSCLSKNRRQGYLRDIKAYVQPWSESLSRISANIHIWHGSEDNWSPKAMAGYLHSALSGSQIEIMAGISHYSCLYEAAPKICKLLNEV